jgi:hypothetical protein
MLVKRLMNCFRSLNMKFTVLLLCFLFISCSSSNQSQNTYEDTKKLLSSETGSHENFIKLFRIGDERVDDLITALNDQDRTVRINAQIIIRSLGNPKATKEMYQWLSENALKEKDWFPTNPIPIPIDEWEYRFEEKSYMYSSRSNLKDGYALFLDNSDKAKAALEKFIEQENNNPYGLGEAKKLERFRKLQIGQTFQENGDLANAVLQTPFFQFKTDSDTNVKESPEKLKSRLITYNSTRTKALLEAQNSDGTYSVIVEKVEKGWKIYSVIRATIF